MGFTKEIKQMIDKKLILANAPSNMNEQVHINHNGCPSGEDTKHRLYIKRNAKGLVAYCHHCTESGFAHDDSGRLSTWFKDKPTVITKEGVMPKLTSLSLEGSVWLHTYYCNVDDINFNGVQGSPKSVALTLHNPDMDAIGYQVRNLVPEATPKYLTNYTYNGNKGDASWFYNGSKTLVMTEDYLSAYRIFRDTGISSVALLRTTISDRTLRQIHDLGFTKVCIWLDPDKAGVEGAAKAYKKLTYFLPNEVLCLSFNKDREPKECTKEELKVILHGL